MFGMAQQYFRRGKNGFTSATVTGERRVGKTMYCLQTVYQICRKKGMSHEEAWETALNSIVFTMKDLIKSVMKHNHRNRRDFVIWDDSGVFGSGMLYAYNIDNAMILKALMDTIGTRVRLLMLTCPDSEGLMKFLRRYQDYLVGITPYNKNIPEHGRLATVLKPYRAKNMSRKWKRAWYDEYDVRIPDEYYDRYVAKRDKYADIILKELTKRGKRGRQIAQQTYGEELVRQSDVFDDVAPVDSEGDIIKDRGEAPSIHDSSGFPD